MTIAIPLDFIFLILSLLGLIVCVFQIGKQSGMKTLSKGPGGIRPIGSPPPIPPERKYKPCSKMLFGGCDCGICQNKPIPIPKPFPDKPPIPPERKIPYDPDAMGDTAPYRNKIMHVEGSYCYCTRCYELRNLGYVPGSEVPTKTIVSGPGEPATSDELKYGCFKKFGYCGCKICKKIPELTPEGYCNCEYCRLGSIEERAAKYGVNHILTNLTCKSKVKPARVGYDPVVHSSGIDIPGKTCECRMCENLRNQETEARDNEIWDERDMEYHRKYEDGHDDGYSEGRDDGYSEGHEEGHEKGDDAGYSRGHDVGYSLGHSTGYRSGYQESKDSQNKIVKSSYNNRDHSG